MADNGSSFDPYGFGDLPLTPVIPNQGRTADPYDRSAGIAAMMGEYNIGKPSDMAAVLDVLYNRANGADPYFLQRNGPMLEDQLNAMRPGNRGYEFDGRPVSRDDGGTSQQNLAYLSQFDPSLLSPQQRRQYDQAAGVFDNYDERWKGIAQGGTLYQNNAEANGASGDWQRRQVDKYGAVQLGDHMATGREGFYPSIADYWNANNGNVGSWYQMPGAVPSEWNKTVVSNPIMPSYDPSFGGLGGLGGMGATPNRDYDPYNPTGGPGMLQNQPGFQLGGPGLALADTHMQPMSWGTPGYGGDATPNYMTGSGMTPGAQMSGYGVNPGYNAAFGNSTFPNGGNAITVNPMSFSFSSGF